MSELSESTACLLVFFALTVKLRGSEILSSENAW